MKTLLVHFDVEDEFILLDTFVDSALAAKRAAQAISVEYFDNSVHIELIILPPEPGSLKQYIAFAVKGTTSFSLILLTLVQFMDSKSVQDISKELYGKIPSEIIIEKIRDLKSAAESDNSSAEELENEGREILEEIVLLSTRSALEIDRRELERIDIPEDLRYELEASQSGLYKAALDDSGVMAIGFDESDEFPISRDQFAARGLPPLRKTDDDSPEEWKIVIEQIRVTSPNFDREDQTSRRWKGRRLHGGGMIHFEIVDPDFWKKIAQSEIRFSGHTDIEAQIAMCFVDGKLKVNKVVKVLKVDGQRQAKRLSTEDVYAFLNVVPSKDKASAQDLLFKDLD